MWENTARKLGVTRAGSWRRSVSLRDRLCLLQAGTTCGLADTQNRSLGRLEVVMFFLVATWMFYTYKIGIWIWQSCLLMRPSIFKG